MLEKKELAIYNTIKYDGSVFNIETKDMIIKLYRTTEDFWFSFDQKIRFILVGGFNTVFAYGVYAFLLEILKLPYMAALILQYFITINVSVITMRYYVFRSKGDFLKEFSKAWSVYIFMLLFNGVGLSFLVEFCHIDELWAQGIYQVVCAIVTYILHKYFSFRKK